MKGFLILAALVVAALVFAPEANAARRRFVPNGHGGVTEITFGPFGGVRSVRNFGGHHSPAAGSFRSFGNGFFFIPH